MIKTVEAYSDDRYDLIALRVFGDATRWKDIAILNPDRLEVILDGGAIAVPDRISPTIKPAPDTTPRYKYSQYDA